MRSAIFAGSFDPFTMGHLDIVKRAAALFETVHVGVLVNPDKRPLFTPDERRNMIEAAVCGARIENVKVHVFGGLLVDFAKAVGADVNIRGLRNGVDFDYEYSMEFYNRRLSPGLETVYLAADSAHIFLSSSAVRTLMAAKADLTGLVPEQIHQLIAERVNSDEQ